MKKKRFIDQEKIFKYEAEGREFANLLKSLELFIRTVKCQNNYLKFQNMSN